MTLEKKHNLIGALVVLCAFIISRLLYSWAGIAFDTTFMFGWQVIDPILLNTDLLRSVFYLHTQPPLWNLFLGVGMQIFPENHIAIFAGIYYMIGIILAVSIYQLGLLLRFPNWLACVISILFIVSPSAILYENMISYAYPLTAMLTWSAIFLYQFIRTKRTQWGVVFFFALTIIALTWSLFHLIWVLGIVVILYFVWTEKKKVVLAALFPVLMLIGWYSKNAVIVGDFTASSWAGMNLSKIAMLRFSEKELKQMEKEKQISPIALIPMFRNPLVYLEYFPETPTTGIPVLDMAETSMNTRNHHHFVYAAASKAYLKDSLRLIYAKPERYLRSVLQAAYIYFHSASDYEFLDKNRALIDSFDQIWNRVFYIQWQSGETPGERFNSLSIRNLGWGIIFAFAAGLLSGIRFLSANRAALDAPLSVLVIFLIYNIIFVTIIGVSMDIGENNRFRFTVDPFLILLFVFFARAWFVSQVDVSKFR